MKTKKLQATRTTWALVSVLLALAVSWGIFHKKIHRALTERLLLSTNNPTEEFFADCVNGAEDPVEFLERCWATGKVTHRQFVASFLKNSAIGHMPWLHRAESLQVACATDADASVRELGLAVLEMEHSPRLFESVQNQLSDLDPLVRVSGLDYLRRGDPKRAVPSLIRALDDSDLRIVTSAEVGLARFSGEDYGVRAHLAIPSPADADQINPANLEIIHRGVEKRKEWWNAHKGEYQAVAGSLALSDEARVADVTRPLAPDFKLPDLQGKPVRLSEFRGKVVLLNFWATWCTACLAELPDLEALQEKMGNQVVILGVALDGVPDEHGDTPGDEVAASRRAHPSLTAVRAKVERAVRARRINYPVLLDPNNSVGGQYNGGELPTTVILDEQGRVRRRFIGERSLGVLEKMVAEAQKPPPAQLSKLSTAHASNR